ncbi:MAG: redoxin domain-containing protein [Thermoanaerobaculia bacterium]
MKDEGRKGSPHPSSFILPAFILPAFILHPPQCNNDGFIDKEATVRTVIAAVLLLSSLTAFGEAGSPGRPVVKKATQAGELAVRRWMQTESQPSIEALRGRVVLLDFWGTWCHPCVDAIPKVAEFARTRPEVTVIGIHSRNGAERLPRFLKDNPFPIPIGVDTGATARSYSVRGWPTYVLIDRKSRIRFRAHFLPGDEIIEALLAEEP